VAESMRLEPHVKPPAVSMVRAQTLSQLISMNPGFNSQRQHAMESLRQESLENVSHALARAVAEGNAARKEGLSRRKPVVRFFSNLRPRKPSPTERLLQEFRARLSRMRIPRDHPGEKNLKAMVETLELSNAAALSQALGPQQTEYHRRIDSATWRVMAAIRAYHNIPERSH
jgi:hypothetical protein